MNLNSINNFLMSLRGRLIISVALVHAILMSVFIIDLTSRQRKMLFEHQTDEAIGLANTLSTTSAEWLVANDIAGLQELVNVQQYYPELVFAIITNAKGEILVHSDKSKNGEFLLDLPQKFQQTVISSTPSLVDVAVPIILSNKNVGWVRIGLEQNVTSAQLREITNNGIIYSILAVLIGSILAGLMGNFVTKRLYSLQETINKVSAGNKNIRAHLKGSDEVAQLSKEFNKMLSTISENEANLIKSENQFKKLFNLAKIPLGLIDNHGNIMNLNENFEKTFGYTIEDIPTINDWWQKAYPDKEYRKWAMSTWENSLKETTSKNVELSHAEYKVTCKKGEVLTIAISGSQLGEGIIASFFDMTEREAAEQKVIKAMERAEESDRLKSAFLANMSHEIRTPMNGILGFAELLKEPGLSGDDQMEYIKIIEKSGERMLNIINDIIDISKIESGQMKFSISETNINNQIEYIYTFFKPEVLSKGIAFSYNISLPLEKAVILTDSEKLYAVLINLVKNAIKYSQEGSIEFGYFPITDKNGPITEITFYVKDTGIGIPEEKLNTVFDRFIQVDSQLKKAVQGAGLGLSISKAYVEMLGGKIGVESKEGKGSTFYFTIPFRKEIEKKIVGSNDAILVEENQIKNLKILIVEDDLISLILLKKIINPFSDHVIVAKTGVEAIDSCKKNPDIDLILMDVNMPDMNGHLATQAIRKFNKNVIIIAQTAYGLSDDREKALESGCNDYVSKPINKDKLKQLIAKYF